ncbi:MAG: two-component system response regulator [Ignavibacteriales bacterium CG18_big_fil_WC_8_21_14_2_50_31_20]|nr:MAG: two-component system response regulator [Ignavibacteriales bacterium CG18_big_fil_WC_8_21_14_2_50_31_20]
MKKAILLVEDNSDDELLTIRALRKNNLVNDIAIARDGAEALDYLLGTHKNGTFNNPLPTLIILDLKLPKIDGIEVLKQLRASERTKLIPIVILTSSKEQQDIIASYGFGANSFIRKPVDFIQFIEVASSIGVYWLALNESPENFDLY